MSKVVYAFRADEDLIKKLENISKKKMRTTSNLICYVLSNYVEQVSD